MKTYLNRLCLLIFIVLLCVCGSRQFHFEDGKIVGINTIHELDKAAALSFAIMSDNKGDSPGSAEQFARMAGWIAESGDRFVIGLGDHLKKGWKNSFLPFIKENGWWHDNFYPNVADGENEYYGDSQGDWGAGRELLGEINLQAHPNVTIRENGCEYYAKIPVDDFTVHLIQLHYSDRPKDDHVAFNEDSRQYLIEMLNQIEKKEKDIIIAAAHSRTGFWIDQLSDEQKDVVMRKCDLVLSATTHFFERKIIQGFEESGPLFINTGSITYPNRYSPYGYVQVHVMENPFSLVVQYIDADRSERELQHSEYAFIKIIDGKILRTNFREPPPYEDMDRIVGQLTRDIPREELTNGFRKFYAEKTGADEAFVAIRSGLEKGHVTVRDLLNILGANEKVCVLRLNAEIIKMVFEDEVPLRGREEIRLAARKKFGDHFIKEMGISEDSVVNTGKREVILLEEWLKGSL